MPDACQRERRLSWRSMHRNVYKEPPAPTQNGEDYPGSSNFNAVVGSQLTILVHLRLAPKGGGMPCGDWRIMVWCGYKGAQTSCSLGADLYSRRKVWTGSTRTARAAGIALAAITTNNSDSATAARVSGSDALTP